MRRTRAYCPSCDAEGPVGRYCTNPVCRPGAYAHVPGKYFAAFKELPGALADKRIGQRLGDVVLVERLSRGAFGRVYIGLRIPVLMRVAVKVLEPSQKGEVDPDLLARKFDGEARALAALGHPNVVRLMAYCPDHEPKYLVMEHVEPARTLHEEILASSEDGSQRLDARRSGAILTQLLWALGDAHEKGVVHLDLRPDNIAIQQARGHKDFVRLLDFGLAVHVDDDEDGLAFGTAEYIAPERILALAAGPPTDLYAVAVMAFRLLAGRSIFGDLSRDDLVEAKQESSFDPAKRLEERGYPPLVVEFFRTSLAFDSAQRFENAERFQARLGPLIEYFSEPHG